MDAAELEPATSKVPQNGLSCLDEGVSDLVGGVPLLGVHAAIDASILLCMVLGNIFIVSCIALQRRHVTGTPVAAVAARFAASLAAADAFVGFATLYYLSFHYLCAVQKGPGSRMTSCVLRFVATSSAHMASAYSLAAIAADRYVAVVHALRYRDLMNSRRTSILISGVWICSFLTNSTLFFWNNWKPGVPCVLEEIVPIAYITGLGFITHGGIITVVALVHYRIHREAMAVSARRRSTESGGAIAVGGGISSKSARIVILVTGVYIICWAPYTLLYLVKVLGHSSPAVELAYNLTFSFANLNYLINPFLYSWKNFVVRTSIQKTLQSIGLYSKSKVMRSTNTITSIT